MKRAKVFLAIGVSFATALALLSLGFTYSAYTRYGKVVQENGSNIPIAVDGYRNTSLYVVPTAWSSLLTGVSDCYIACCLFKDADVITAYEWQFIRTCNESMALISENRTAITVGNTNYNAYKFTLDLTYYDRISFHRIAYTANLGEYIGEKPDKITTKAVPFDWRNIDKSPTYKRYDATHTQVKKPTSNVFEITSTNSGGAYGFLAWGEWRGSAPIA